MVIFTVLFEQPLIHEVPLQRTAIPFIKSAFALNYNKVENTLHLYENSFLYK